VQKIVAIIAAARAACRPLPAQPQTNQQVHGRPLARTNSFASGAYRLYGRAKLSQVPSTARATFVRALTIRLSCPREPLARTSRSWTGQAVELHDECRV